MWRSWQERKQWKSRRFARGGSRLRFPPAAGGGAGPESALPPPLRRGGASFPRSLGRAGPTPSGSLVPRICWTKGKAGVCGLSTRSALLRTLFLEPIWDPQLTPPTSPLPRLSSFSVLKAQLRDVFPLQPAAFATRANIAQRAARCGNHAFLPKSAPPGAPARIFVPTGRLPAARGQRAPQGKGAARARAPGGPRPVAERVPAEPQCPQKPPLAVGRFWVPSTRGHQKPSESCGAHANERLRHVKYKTGEQAPRPSLIPPNSRLPPKIPDVFTSRPALQAPPLHPLSSFLLPPHLSWFLSNLLESPLPQFPASP